MVANHVIQPVVQADVLLELAQLNDKYTEILNRMDVYVRALYNPKISAINFRLYLSLIEKNPQLLDGREAEIEVFGIRGDTGIKESSATRFFQDLVAIGRIRYESNYDRKSGQRKSVVTPLPGFEYPESFDTNSSERKRKAREAEEKRRKQFKDPRKLHSCPVCGSEDLLFDVVAHCRCGYVAEPIVDIPASDIVIEAETIEIEDDPFGDEPTQKVPVVRKPAAAVQIEMSAPAPARTAPRNRQRHPYGLACPDCHSEVNWRVVRTSYGSDLYVCGICSPEE